MSDLDKLQRRNKQIIAFLILLVLLNIVMIFLYVVSNSSRNNERIEPAPAIAGYTPIKGKDYFDGQDGKTPVKNKDYFDGITPACYFEPNQCKGTDGYTPQKQVDYFDGVTPPCYFTESQCQGYTPVKDVDYFDGENGVNGTNGRNREIRCNTETQLFETKLEGDEDWQPLEGSDCVAD